MRCSCVDRVPALLALVTALLLAPLASCNRIGELPTIGQTTATAATSPTRPARDVRLFVMPEDGQEWLLDLIAAARQRVLMKVYVLTDARIVGALQRAARRGVNVRAMIEAHPFGSDATADQAFRLLRDAGITVKAGNPAFRYTHEKSVVIDDAVVILTANMTRSAFDRNREFAVLYGDRDDVSEIVAAFEADWLRARFTPRSPSLVWSPVNARARINALITSARSSLYVYASSAPDEEQIGLLADAAGRGVDVRFLTSIIRPVGRDDRSDDEADLNRLRRSRVKVGHLQSPIIHAKAIIADQAAFVGSINLTTNSLDFNRELGIVFDDPSAVRRLTQTFEADWSRAAAR